eukprot:scaffold22593_cov117-Isochrysis_galbana.AAC.1
MFELRGLSAFGSVRRTETQNLNVRDALRAPPPKPCQRFANGICLLNKKGKKCSSNHDLPDAWVTTPDGITLCAIECNLKAHPTHKDLCTNGKECLYKHSKRAAPKCVPSHFPPPAPIHLTTTRAIVYARVFDATLGFPGEGPLIVATYNINGTRGSLAAVLAQAKQAKIDILLLQELHFYEDGEHGRVGSLADRLGWTLVHSPATRIDPSSGVAIAVRIDSRSVKPIVTSARSVIRGRYITPSAPAECWSTPPIVATFQIYAHP